MYESLKILQPKVVVISAVIERVYSRAIIQNETLSGCEVKRISVHGGCLGSQRR